mmetsp:Transcript_38340/g.97277  ORF Transcript_38340/g.97277 Transcript_38340/m.97277 type:complete len:330 (+) Transcript_38340:86-1075(+)
MASSMQKVLALGCLLGLHLLRLGLHLAQEQGQAGDIRLLDLVDAIVELLQLHGLHHPSLQVHTALAARQHCLHLLLVHHGLCGAAPRVAHRLLQVRLCLHLLGIEHLEGGLEFLHTGAQIGKDPLHLWGQLRRLAHGLRHKDLLGNRLLHLNCAGHLGLDRGGGESLGSCDEFRGLLHLRSILHRLFFLLLVLLLSLLLPFHGLLFGDQLAQRLLFLEEVLLELEDLQLLFLDCEHPLLFNQLALHLGNLARNRGVRQVVLQTRKLLDGPRNLLALSITHQFPSLDLIHDAVHRGGDHLGLRQNLGAHVAALNQLFQAALHGRQLPLRF